MSDFSDFSDVHIILSGQNVNIYNPMPKIDFSDFSDAQVLFNEKNFCFQDTETKEERHQYNSGQGFFLGENYKIQPLPQADAQISAATGWTTSTVFTFDELVAEAAASPAAGNYGHIELYYYYNEIITHNIAYMTIELADSVVKTIYSFNYTT